jgi:hypothetical protein
MYNFGNTYQMIPRIIKVLRDPGNTSEKDMDMRVGGSRQARSKGKDLKIGNS